MERLGGGKGEEILSFLGEGGLMSLRSLGVLAPWSLSHGLSQISFELVLGSFVLQELVGGHAEPGWLLSSLPCSCSPLLLLLTSGFQEVIAPAPLISLPVLHLVAAVDRLGVPDFWST